ncbi:nuclear transport factor 2 family protein [Streptomyces sp. RLB3-17]|nr:nuclear transport factor 2 family protein [Streptomyces sp. RLB3-6]QDO45999.1 nuclear transport factor 2 family protein [Streptomyces sp. RLB3-17]
MSVHLIDAVDRLCDAINSHTAQRVADCFTADYAAEVPHRPAESFTGREQVLMNWSLIFTRVPDLKARVLRTAVSGSEAWSEWEMSGTSIEGLPALLVGPVVMTVRDGRINWTRFYVSPVPPVSS